jgi:hypothetical protein
MPEQGDFKNNSPEIGTTDTRDKIEKAFKTCDFSDEQIKKIENYITEKLKSISDLKEKTKTTKNILKELKTKIIEK